MAEENTVKTPVYGGAVAQLRAGAAVRMQRMKAHATVRAGSYPANLIGPRKLNIARGRVKIPSAMAILYPKAPTGKTDEDQGTPAQAA